jgi:hypothetical protein
MHGKPAIALAYFYISVCNDGISVTGMMFNPVVVQKFQYYFEYFHHICFSIDTKILKNLLQKKPCKFCRVWVMLAIPELFKPSCKSQYEFFQFIV